MLIGYARVSTDDQNLDLQRDALRLAGCEKIYEDRMSGAKAARPGLTMALEVARAGDVLTVWRLDRLARGARSRGSDGSGSRAGAPVALVGDHLDCRQDRLHWADAERMGEEGGARQRTCVRPDDGDGRRLKALERENRELRQANEILRKASAYFAQAELDRRHKP